MKLEKDGCEILRRVIARSDCEEIRREISGYLNSEGSGRISQDGKAGSHVTVGGRNLQQHWSGWRRITDHPVIQEFARRHVGGQAGLVRILFFDKPPGHSWALSLHRDQTSAVKEHQTPLAPFSKPTRKSGVPHVQATHSLLATMLTLRLHLDPMHGENGPLTVVPKSHIVDASDEFGQESDEIPGCDSDRIAEPTQIHVDAGDVFAMRPQILHGSLPSSPSNVDHRGVVHLELAPNPMLPGNYRWNQFDSL